MTGRFKVPPEREAQLYEEFKASFYAPGKREEIARSKQDIEGRLMKSLDVIVKDFQGLYQMARDVAATPDIFNELMVDHVTFETTSKFLRRIKKELQDNPSEYFTPEEVDAYIPLHRKADAINRIQLAHVMHLRTILESYEHTLEDLSIVLGYKVTPEDLLSPNFKEAVLNRFSRRC